MRHHVEYGSKLHHRISTGKYELKVRDTSAIVRLAKGMVAQSPLFWYPFSRLVGLQEGMLVAN